MTYRPPAIREAIDLTNAMYDAALDTDVAAFTYGAHDTHINEVKHILTRNTVDVARAKLIEHLEQMARSERGAA